MIHTATPQLLGESERLHLKFACEDCVHHDEELVGCSLGYPDADHRRSSPMASGRFVFCKEFELR